MRRLFWVGVGAVGAVVVVQRFRQVVHRFTPEGVAEQVEDVGARTTTALRGAADEFRTARAERERELIAALLVTPEGGEYVRRRDRVRDEPPAAYGSAARPIGRVDEDEPLYDF
jgi:hypothetical protein